MRTFCGLDMARESNFVRHRHNVTELCELNGNVHIIGSCRCCAQSSWMTFRWRRALNTAN